MDFNKYAQGSASSGHHHVVGSKNYDHLTDPYVRRYHIAKIALKSLSYGLVVHASKTIIENITNRRFYKMSPWLELAVITGVFSAGLYDKFHSRANEAEELVALRKFKQQHFFNSQYHH